LASYCQGYYDKLAWVAPSPPPPSPPSPPLQENVYPLALGLALQFYEAQQSGHLPDWNRFLVTAGGFRRDSHLLDGSTAQLDLSGGYYDAGDTVKFTLPLGVAMSVLAWGGVQFKAAFRATGQLPVLLRTLKWGTDWLIKAHFNASDVPSKNQLVVQVGGQDGITENACLLGCKLTRPAAWPGAWPSFGHLQHYLMPAI
jgi:hypothetical protein